MSCEHSSQSWEIDTTTGLMTCNDCVNELRNPLNALAAEILDINRSNGWNVPVPGDWATPSWEGTSVITPHMETKFALVQAITRYKIPTSLALIHSKVSEALEEFRKEHRLEQFGEELADTLIRVLELMGGLGIDADSAVAAKLAKNRTRGHRHGGRLV